MKINKKLIVSMLLLTSFVFACENEDALEGQQPSIYEIDWNSKLSIKRFDLPLTIQRQAVQYLESLRGTELAPSWNEARLGKTVVPFYRPDIDGPAYYEFSVYPKGFIMVSSGNHDYPIAHWSSEAKPPSARLREMLEEEQHVIANFFKLDMLSYVAENENGDLVAQLGELPLELIRNDAAASQSTNYLSTWTPSVDDQGNSTGGELITRAIKDEDSSEIVAHEVIENGEHTVVKQFQPSFSLQSFNSWQDLKTSYPVIFDHSLQQLKKQAAISWDFYKDSDDHPRLVIEKTDLEITMLKGVENFSVNGDGAQFVDITLENRDNFEPTLRLTIGEIAKKQQLPLAIKVNYMDGTSENLSYQITKKIQDVGAMAGNLLEPTALSSGNPWEWTVIRTDVHNPDGSSPAQRNYGQYSRYSAQNPSSCSSGCGATAWGMMFGWVDYMAHRNPFGDGVWRNHTGIYRENGGYGNAAIQAPDSMWDNGVSNMVMEIRRHIGTFCSGNNGATFPWDMGKAAFYLTNRDALKLQTAWNDFGQADAGNLGVAINSIIQGRTPVVIGTGFFSHYPVAFSLGYRPADGQIIFQINNGWGNGGDNDEWIPAATWFSGVMIALN